MSDPQHQLEDDSPDRYDDDIEENDHPNAVEPDAATTPKDVQPPKRGRGRPRGSKNKKSGAASPTIAPSEAAPGKKKRGRPPKEKKADDSGAEEPPAKRRRGRPRKDQKPQEAATLPTTAPPTGESSGESSVKKKRGRPPKKT